MRKKAVAVCRKLDISRRAKHSDMIPSEPMQILQKFRALQNTLSMPPKKKKNYFFVGHLFADIAFDYIAKHLSSKPYKVVLGPLWIKELERIQWDGALVRKEACQILERYYKPEDVIALFEFKTSGIYGGRARVREVVKGIRDNFAAAQKICPNIKSCFYVALHERTPKRSGSVHYFNKVKELREQTVTTCMLFSSESLEEGRQPVEYPNEWSNLLNALAKL